MPDGQHVSLDSKQKDQPALASFNWSDPFLLSEQLTEDKRMISESANAFANEHFAPKVIKAYANETVDRDVFTRWASMDCSARPYPSRMGASGQATSHMG